MEPPPRNPNICFVIIRSHQDWVGESRKDQVFMSVAGRRIQTQTWSSGVTSSRDFTPTPRLSQENIWESDTGCGAWLYLLDCQWSAVSLWLRTILTILFCLHHLNYHHLFNNNFSNNNNMLSGNHTSLDFIFVFKKDHLLDKAEASASLVLSLLEQSSLPLSSPSLFCLLFSHTMEVSMLSPWQPGDLCQKLQTSSWKVSLIITMRLRIHNKLWFKCKIGD